MCAFLMVYISVSAVTAAIGSALTAGHLEKRNAARPVGASLLAMEVNDDAGSLTPRGALRFFVGTPPGASSLLQSPPPSAIHGWGRLTRGSLPAGLFAGLDPRDFGRLTGRHREQARSHRRAKDDRCTPTLFTTHQAER
ncbi:hypothetical protein D3C81_1848370 [compost metagenome]